MRGSDPSDDDGTQASLRTLLGSVFGGMVFIALVFLACFFLYRYRRRKSRGSWGFGSEKPLRSGRGSPDSSTGLQHGYQSRLSLYSDGSSTRSLYDFISQQPFVASATQGRYSNPFSDSARMQRASTPSLENTTRFPLIDTSDIPEPTQPPMTAQSVLPRRAYSADWGVAQTRHERINSGGVAVQFPTFGTDEDSIHSGDRSLGSTVILPGRSSMGSSHLQRFSYQMSLAELGYSDPAGGPSEPITRTSTRSDPFDLVVPPKAIHRRSSSALPGALPGMDSQV
ncbi:hypothetical protein FE257_011959 [Aspergillus nanangensis]|uniref:Uncharacterized protein n=1 Tax=Aspergillus nanangensis TaxID=2582783 RepID=A0AAD4CGM0_ASPNN|nr:hypothetical protein FE257_011959 [Aspergillus nanangensis]